MLGAHLPKHRQFRYTPQYWDPEKEEREGHKIKFKRTHLKQKAERRSLIWLFVLLAFVFYLIHFFSRLGR
jgi:hypothetical protein